VASGFSRKSAAVSSSRFIVDIHHIDSTFLRARRRITVMRPRFRDRDAPQDPPAVLYLNDGQNLFDPARAFAGNTWRVAQTVNWLAGEGRIPPILVVGIDHGEVRRAREYLPVEDERNPSARRPLGRQYVDFVTREVVPFVERTYKVSRRTSGRAFGGSSYGAVAALLAVLERPGTFGRLLLESPSLYVGNRFLLRKARRAPRWPARVYLGVGTAETSKADVNRETVENVRVLESILQDAGLGSKRLQVVVQEGATHSEGAWAGRLGDALTFLFGR
jgi:predicted alpha/beta superfamily hydrolase